MEAGRAYLAHQVNIADVNSQLQGRGGDADLDLAGLEFLFGIQADFAGQAAVVGYDGLFTQACTHLVGHSFHKPPGVDEHQRRLVLVDHPGDGVQRFPPQLV